MARRSAGFVNKKPHRKSRGGCLTCKRKKVKCDEAQPACGYCSLRRSCCEYLQDPALQSPQATTTSVSPLQVDSPSAASTTSIHDVDFNDTRVEIPNWIIPAAHASTGQLNPLDFELLHHYKTSTWRNFVVPADPVIHALHRDIIPHMSVSHNYLLYALLSIAATHRNSLQPSKQLENQALIYRQLTFEVYSKALQNITSENYETLLVTASFLLSLMPSPGFEADDDQQLDWMHSILKMTEGLRVLASLRWSQGIEKLTVYPLIRRELQRLPPPPVIDVPNAPYIPAQAGALGTTPEHPNPAPMYQAVQFLPLFGSSLFLPPSLMALLQPLTTSLATGPIDLHRNTLVPVFHALSPIFLSLYYYHLNPDFYVRVFAFTSFLMPEFLMLVKTREPRALVLIAWWWALADLVPKGWWVGDCVGRVIEAMGRVIRQRGEIHTIEAFEGPERIVRVFESCGREAAGESVFEAWDGVNWDDGPRKAEEWELGLLVELSDVLDFDIQS